MENKAYFVSLIVCAYNDENTIRLVIDGINHIRYPYKEIIVINDSSTDGTKNIVSEYKGIKQIVNKINLGLAESMNIGLKEAKGEIIIFIQSDCVIQDNNWIEKMIEPFENKMVGAVISQRYVNPKNLSIGAKLFNSVCPQDLLNTNKKPLEAKYFRGKADAYRKKIIEELGGWDSKTFFISGEDTDLSIKMREKGYKIILSNNAFVENILSSRQDTILGGLKKALLYGLSASKLYRIHRYDGLRTRLFLLCLISFVFIPIWIINRQLGMFFYTVILLLSFRHRIIGEKILLSFYLLTCLAMTVIVNLNGLIDIGLVNYIPFSVLSGLFLFCIYIVLKSCIYCIRQNYSIFLLPVVSCYVLCWRFLSGVGYLKGYTESLRKDDATHGQKIDKKFKGVLKICGKRKNNKILDIGAGGGALLSVFKEDNLCIGLDNEKKNCELLEKQGIKAILSDCIKMPFENEYFDLIIASEIIEHINDIDDFFNEIKRILKKEGELVIVVPNDYNWFIYRVLNLCFASAVRNRGHVRRFNSLKRLYNLFDSAGFKVLDCCKSKERIKLGRGRFVIPLNEITLHYIIKCRMF